MDELLKGKRKEILNLAARHGARNVRIFGSVARGAAGPDSDVDVSSQYFEVIREKSVPLNLLPHSRLDEQRA